MAVAPFKYVKSTNINMKVHGVYDSALGVIVTKEEDEDIPRKILSLLSEFDGKEIDLSVTNKDSENLEEPEEDED